MVDTSALTALDSANAYASLQPVADALGISLNKLIILAGLLLLWALVWKGFALWKSVKHTKFIWFVTFLITQTYGLLEIPYMFIFSKIKDEKRFRQVHNILLIIGVLFLLLSFWDLRFVIVSGIAFIWFIISILQTALDKNNKGWLFLGIIALAFGSYFISNNYQSSVALLKLDMKLLIGILVSVIIPIIYYVSKIKISNSETKKKR